LQEAGGDRRGKQSAAIRTVKVQPYPHVDLCVDEHPEPITELRRIYEVFKVQMLPFVEALPTRKNPKEDLGDDIRGTLIPDGASQDGRASEGASPNQSSGLRHEIAEKS
jgi:uncharacterized Ntn-hydrolase superfamily protein